MEKGLGTISFPLKIGIDVLQDIGGGAQDFAEYGTIGEYDISPGLNMATQPVKWLAQGIETLRKQLAGEK